MTVQVDQTTSTSAAGSLTFTGAVTGTGGFTKQGDGLATFSNTSKTYTGATVLSGGRMRMSPTASPTATPSFTINAGAQLTLITAATYAFGSGPLNLNGAGPSSGPYSAFPGAIRNDSGLSVTIANQVVLQSNTLLHVQNTNTVTGSLTLTNSISGPGSLTLMAVNSDSRLGELFLTGANTYEGGTFVNGGVLNVNSDAALGASTGALALDGKVAAAGFSSKLRATGNISTTSRTLIVGNVGTNQVGGTIDTNGNDVTFGVGSVITGTTLTKVGEGKLTVAGMQTYETLTAIGGTTDLASALGSGASKLNAGAVVNISASQTLAALDISDGGIVTLASPLPAAPAFADAESGIGSDLAASPAVPVPEPGISLFILGGLSFMLGQRRRKDR